MPNPKAAVAENRPSGLYNLGLPKAHDLPLLTAAEQPDAALFPISTRADCTQACTCALNTETCWVTCWPVQRYEHLRHAQKRLCNVGSPSSKVCFAQVGPHGIRAPCVSLRPKSVEFKSRRGVSRADCGLPWLHGSPWLQGSEASWVDGSDGPICWEARVGIGIAMRLAIPDALIGQAPRRQHNRRQLNILLPQDSSQRREGHSHQHSDAR